MRLIEFIVTAVLSLNAGFVIGAWWATRKTGIETVTLEDTDHE